MTNSTGGSAFSFFLGSSTSGKRVTERSSMIGYVVKERVDGKLILPEAVQILKLQA